MKKQSNRREQTYSVDRLMLNLAKALVGDFQDVSDRPGEYHTLSMELRTGNVTGIRNALPALDYNSDDPYIFKMDYQIASLFKRYRFSKDLYSDDELEELALEKFCKTQDRLRAVDYDAAPWMVSNIIDMARDYIARTLGVYNREEHGKACRFGSGASVGVPSRIACEAARWELPISGTKEEIAWFDEEIRHDTLAQEYIEKQKAEKDLLSAYHEVEALPLTLVPKSYKSLRTIVPCSTIGSYITRGLGTMIATRLKRKGYNIARLQDKHKSLAQSASISGTEVTVDLSSASDSISTRLVKMLLPPDWFEVLNLSRCNSILLPNNHVVELETFALMGNGYTFPLQTLIFLALLKATEGFWFNQLKYPKDFGKISVYGDDMVFHTDMYVYVEKLFSALGFQVNVDKTFTTGHFRESCGGDYHHGVDVRPFQPKNDQAVMGKLPYESYLYKLINGLLRRWSEYEIGRALNVLTCELERVVHKIKIVPPDYSDMSGIRCYSLDTPFFRSIPVCKPKHVGHGVFRFPYLRLMPEYRKEERHAPYCWLATGTAGSDPDTWIGSVRGRECSRDDAAKIVVGLRIAETPLLREDAGAVFFGPGETGFKVRIRSKVTRVVIRNTGTLKRQFGVTSLWTP